MSIGFAAVAESGFLELACAELSAQFEFKKKRQELWVPERFLGVWVGGHAALNLSFVSSFGFPSRWVMVSLDEPSLTRIGLLELLLSKSVGHAHEAGPRFHPVFSRQTSERARLAELSELRAVYPEEVGVPLLMNPMTGCLDLAACV